MLWDPFLMKVLLKKEVCGSREQCTDLLVTQKRASAKKKQKQKQNADAGTWMQSKHILSQDCQMRACDLWTFLIFTWKCHEFYIPM